MWCYLWQRHANYSNLLSKARLISCIRRWGIGGYNQYLYLPSGNAWEQQCTRMQCTRMSPDDQWSLFRPIQSTKNGECLLEAGKISYSCLRHLFHKKLADLDFLDEFGLYSLRVGDATAAANVKVPDRMLKRHGVWSSENAKDSYVNDDVKNRLKVSKGLGLYIDTANSLLWWP